MLRDHQKNCDSTGYRAIGTTLKTDDSRHCAKIFGVTIGSVTKHLILQSGAIGVTHWPTLVKQQNYPAARGDRGKIEDRQRQHGSDIGRYRRLGYAGR
jgi:hypothetical protein